MNTEEALLVFTALSQETRLNIFRILVDNSLEGICPCKIAEQLKIPRNTLSFHLSLLTQAKLCSFEKSGKMLIYKPNCKEIEKVMKFLHKDCISCHMKDCSDCQKVDCPKN